MQTLPMTVALSYQIRLISNIIIIESLRCQSHQKFTSLETEPLHNYHSKNPERSFCTTSNPGCNVSEVCNSPVENITITRFWRAL